MAHLQTHPLINLVRAEPLGAMAGGRALRQALLDAIEALHPELGAEAMSQVWRAYRILELRYIEGQEVAQVSERLALSKSQYHREHQRALAAVASVLWERWRLPERWPLAVPQAPARSGETDYLIAREASLLSHEIGSGPVDPVEVLREICQLLSVLCKRYKVTLHLHSQEHGGSSAHQAFITTNRVTLRHALLPILAKAIETSCGSEIELGIQHKEKSVEITISGTSTRPQDQKKLDLSECLPFVKLLNGHIIYESWSDTSRTWMIRISLPRACRLILLVVDNNADFVRLIERFLAGYGWEVRGAARVEEALAIAQQRLPAAILLDILIPNRDGLDLLIELKRNSATQGIPVIVCSVLHESQIAISLGAAAYLHKPIKQEQLLEALIKCQRQAC
jgi:CheY-like chemotaxis protein